MRKNTLIWLSLAFSSGVELHRDENSHHWTSVQKTCVTRGRPVGQYERLILMAEDELTQYSTDARKIEKLRQKIGLSVPIAEQRQIKDTLQAEMPTDWLSQLVEQQRQTVALPFWGIAGLGLLLGIAMLQPLDLIATIAGGTLAFRLQKWGWRLQAKRLLLQTLEDIESRIQSNATSSDRSG